VNCPACGAPITLKPDTAGFSCGYCHAVFFPGEEDDGVKVSGEPIPSDLSCPLCSLPLVHATIAEAPLLRCESCRGLLLPMNVLPGLIETLRQGLDNPKVQTPPDHGDLKRTIQCPKCHRRMDTHLYAGPGNVILDSCGDCFLLWLDRGELTRIAHAPDESDSSASEW
jgi:Zn-finger nucleic acid-binding protein